MVDNSGIKGLEERDIQSTRKGRRDARLMMSTQEKEMRRIDSINKLKTDVKQAIPFVTQSAIEFAPGIDALDVLGKKPALTKEQQFEKPPSQRFMSGIQNIKEGDRAKGVGEVIDAGLTYLGASGDVALASAPVTGPAGLVAYGALKSISKGGKYIMETKLGQKFLASFEKQKDGTDKIVNVEIPKGTNDEQILMLEKDESIPTTVVDSTDIETEADEGIKALESQDIKDQGIGQIPLSIIETTPLKGLDIVQRVDETPLINKKGKIKVVDIFEYLDNPVKRSVLNQKDFDDMIQEAKEEIAYQLKQEKTGKDWYDGDIEKTMKLLEEDNPNFYGGGEKKDLLVFLTSIMSSGQNVGYDMKVALKIMDKYIETGTIFPRNPDNLYTKKEAKKYKKRGQPSIEGTPKAWTQQTNDKALAFTDAFIKDKGINAFIDFIHAPTTRREASKLAEKYGLKPFLGRKDEPIIGANLFGPKIGNFMQNMMGMDTDANVADIWFTRMMNRRQGNMFMVPKTGKNKGKRISIDQPQSVPIREAYDRFIDVLSKEMGESKRDTQAILWYFEQGLYSKLGVPSEPKKYSEVVEGILKQRRDDARRSISQSNVFENQKKRTSKTSRTKARTRTKTNKIKRAEGGFVDRNTYDWVYTNG